jgi:hypothetical protein
MPMMVDRYWVVPKKRSTTRTPAGSWVMRSSAVAALSALGVVLGCAGQTSPSGTSDAAATDGAVDLGAVDGPSDRALPCGAAVCSAGQLCVHYASAVGGAPCDSACGADASPAFECVALPAACGGSASCDCVAPDICGSPIVAKCEGIAGDVVQCIYIRGIARCFRGNICADKDALLRLPSSLARAARLRRRAHPVRAPRRPLEGVALRRSVACAFARANRARRFRSDSITRHVARADPPDYHFTYRS